MPVLSTETRQITHSQVHPDDVGSDFRIAGEKDCKNISSANEEGLLTLSRPSYGIILGLKSSILNFWTSGSLSFFPTSFSVQWDISSRHPASRKSWHPRHRSFDRSRDRNSQGQLPCRRIQYLDETDTSLLLSRWPPPLDMMSGTKSPESYLSHLVNDYTG